MAVRTLVNKQVELMVWKCATCSAERGYLEPGTTSARDAHLLCDHCGGMTLHHPMSWPERWAPKARRTHRLFTVRLQL